MKLVSYIKENSDRLGLYHNGNVYDIAACVRKAGIGEIPSNMGDFLRAGAAAMQLAKTVNEQIIADSKSYQIENISESDLISPVPHPTSCRDGYAFRQHVASARRNRNVEMIPEFDEYPIFYFTNHNAIQGPGDIPCMPDHFQKLDFELEASIVIGKEGMNITADEADDYIAGYMIMNDMSARLLQIEEMKLNLGPAKGKDFSTVIGPWLVTPDELAAYETKPKEGHTGKSYALDMKCWVNGTLVSQGNMGDMDWTFAEIVERCAYGTKVLPGDVIGSGTVGTGCFLELNGTGLLNDPNYKPQWLQPGDVVEMEITGLGHLKNTITEIDSDLSLFKLKKPKAATAS